MDGVVGDDGHVLDGDGRGRNGPFFGDMVRIRRGIYLYVAGYIGSHFPFDNAVPDVVLFTYHRNVGRGVAA